MITFNEPRPASPSVFISSTVKEFRDLRSAIAYSLRTQGFTVFLSEAADFDVRGDRSAIDECRANIRQSDYYLLLIGSNRGNVTPEGISITREEYRVAREHFLSSGHPRLFLYLRQASEIALSGNPDTQKVAGIDDPVHLGSFIGEVQKPQMEGAPNYLTRFHDFEDLFQSLAGRMNLGRNLAEKLARYSLESELLANLAVLVSRTSSGIAFPSHWYLSRTREEVSITAKELDKDVVISPDHIVSLVLALVGRTQGEDICTTAMEESLSRGVFLTFNRTTGVMEESPHHKDLGQLVDDIQKLRKLDSPTSSQDWDWEILKDIKNRWRGRPHSLDIAAWKLVKAFAYYDRLDNVFIGHLAIVRMLLGLDDERLPHPRRPVTPIAGEEKHMGDQLVPVAEVANLLKNDTWPFGGRIPRRALGKTHDAQVETIVAGMRRNLVKAGMDIRLFQENILKTVAEKVLNDIAAQESQHGSAEA